MRSDRVLSYTAAATAALATASAHGDTIIRSSGEQTVNQTNNPIGTIDAVELFYNNAGDAYMMFAKNYVSAGGSVAFAGFKANTYISWFQVQAGDSIFTNSAPNANYSSMGVGTLPDSSWGNSAFGLGENQLWGFGFDRQANNTTYRHVGWVSFSLTEAQFGYHFVIHDWAFQTTSGGSIIAGQYTDAGGGGAVPGLGGLAALACGAAGVRSRRQRVA